MQISLDIDKVVERPNGNFKSYLTFYVGSAPR